MILTVSERTDIPAFYTLWFFKRLEEGYVDVKNPYNPKVINRYFLSKDDVDVFVFFTKDATKFINYLDKLDGYNYYFHYTINGYGTDLEENVPSKRNIIIDNFIELAKKIGTNKMIWRYDPIILTTKYDLKRHLVYFSYIASKLCGYTKKVVISFVDYYKGVKEKLTNSGLKELTLEDIDYLADNFSKIAHEYGMEIATCGEEIDLSRFGIKKNKCIDDELIYNLFGLKFREMGKKRKNCQCIKSYDIGAYSSCMHKCRYCYANSNNIKNNYLAHDINSSLLLGYLDGTEKIITHKRDKTLFSI